jgi:outer membrane lipoprotein carrier protein
MKYHGFLKKETKNLLVVKFAELRYILLINFEQLASKSLDMHISEDLDVMVQIKHVQKTLIHGGMMKHKNSVIVIFIITLISNAVFAQQTSLDKALTVIEKRYRKASFAANFKQESTLKAMDMTDTASGHALFKWPGMMYWTYEKPEKQYIITNGNDLWIYRPSDNQVMQGKSPDYFGRGKGGSFLTDIGLLRSSFELSWAQTDDPNLSTIKAPCLAILLIPHKKHPDFDKLYLIFHPKTGDIKEIITLNAYKDRTRIQFTDVKFNQSIDDKIFSFSIPEGTDVVQLEQ